MQPRPRVGLPLFGAAALPVRFLLGLQSVVLVLAIAGIAIIDGGETAPLAWALIALVAVSPFVRVIVALEALSALFGAALYGGLQIARTIQGGDYLLEAFAGLLSFAAVAWLGRAIAECLASMEEEAARNAFLVDELTTHDAVTGTIKRRHARELLVEEVLRSRRYNHPLTILIVEVDDWQAIKREVGTEGATKLLALEGEILANLVRSVDKVSRHAAAQFAVIMPETGLQGARYVAEKVCRRMADEAGVTVRIGIAEYPTDGVTSEELAGEAEAALQFARTASIRIADRTLIS